MRKKFAWIIVLALLAPLAGLAQRPHIVILHTNDTHSQIEPFAPDHKKYGDMGGVLRRKAIVDSIRQAEPYVLLVDAGDVVQGTPYFNLFGGKVEFEVMDLLRYDVRTLGNHEFDAGLENLAELIKDSSADFISSNYDVSATPLNGLIKPYVLKTVGPYTVGFLALNINPKDLVPAESYTGLVFLDPIKAANETAALLRERGADIVVALSHLGYIAENPANVTDPMIAAASRDIDIIIGGHSHLVIDPEQIEAAPESEVQYRVKNKAGREVIVTQTGMGGAYVGCIAIDPK